MEESVEKKSEPIEWKPGKHIRTFRELAGELDKDPELQATIKDKPIEIIRMLGKTAGTPLETDRWIYRCVVISLGVVVLAAIGGSIALALKGHEKFPEILLALGSAAVGAMAGLLAPSPFRPTGQGE